MRSVVCIVIAGLVLMAAAGCVPVSAPVSASATAPAAEIGEEVRKVRQAREKNRKRLEAQRRLADKYRQRNRVALNADEARGDERPRAERTRRTRIRAPSPQGAAAGFASGGEAVAAHFSNVPLRVVADALAVLTGANIVVAGEIAAETVTFRVARAPWRDALSALARTQGWAVRDDGGFIRLRKHDGGDGGGTTATAVAGDGVDLLQFFHIAPDDMKKAVAPLFADAADKPVMSVDKRTGSLMVKATAADIGLIEELAEKLDRPAQQILIETFIVEAGTGFERSLGARLGIDRLDAGGVIRVGGVAGGQVVNLPVASPAGGIGFSLDADRLRLELTALEREGKTRIVSNPRIFTLNGREAVIFQGDEVPYFSVSENGTQTEFKEAGVRLAVTPVIVGGGNLILDVTVNKDTVDTRVQNPPITRRQIKTKLLVADGAMVTIGGIYFDTRVSAETRVPWFGRLPWLGRLFRRSQDTRDFRELLVFIAPKIVGASS